MDISDDSTNLETGDLGLGEGLKPGSLGRCDQTVENGLIPNRTMRVRSAPEVADLTFPSGHDANQNYQESCLIDDATNKLHNQEEDVRLGTSLRQQKLLYEQDLEDILKKYDMESNGHDGTEHISDKSNGLFKVKQTRESDIRKAKSACDEEKVYKLLIDAQQEIEVLRQDLELCQKQLHSKYKAIEILQKQAFKDGQIPVNLREEIQKLQFELEYRQSTMMNSQELWAERFDRVCQENLSLASELESKTDDIRKLVAEKMALARERDELLALLDIQERQQFESNRSQSSSEDGYYDFTSSELALLGACHCRVMEPDPCGCAHSAVALRRDVVRLKDELQRQKERKDEALITTDAYRMAFEEQLSRNSSLLKKMALLTNPPNPNKPISQSKKVKAALKWLLEQFYDDDSSYGATQMKSLEDFETQDEQLILMLVDMVCDKCEALAHQRLATKMLASKTKELEKKVRVSDTDPPDQVFQDNVTKDEPPP